MLGTVLTLTGAAVFAVYRVAQAEALAHASTPTTPATKSWTRFALPGFAVIFIGICAWVSAGDWQSAKHYPDPPELSDDTFRSATLLNHTMVLEYGAAWCVSCKKTAPEFAKFAAENEGKFRCFKMDVDRSPVTARLLKVELLPCMMVIVDGKVCACRTGPITESGLYEWVDQNMPKP